MKLQRICVSSLVAICLFVPGVARADPDDDVPRETVKISDLDLSTSEGESVFHARLEAAVNRVCRDAGRNLRSCRREAIAGARRQLEARRRAGESSAFPPAHDAHASARIRQIK